MKKLFLLLSLFVFINTSNAAPVAIDTLPNENSNHNYLFYETKAKKQKTISLVLVCVGLTSGLISGIISLQDLGHLFEPGEQVDHENTAAVFAYVGLTLMAIGIPLAFISFHNEKKARKLRAGEKIVFSYRNTGPFKQLNAGIVFRLK